MLLVLVSSMERSRTSILSRFYSIVERAKGIARELEDSAKRKT